ncbi:hypothetical protein JCM30204_29610 [Dysgonomonas termitidis]
MGRNEIHFDMPSHEERLVKLNVLSSESRAKFILIMPGHEKRLMKLNIYYEQKDENSTYRYNCAAYCRNGILSSDKEDRIA